ncbi:PAS domain S-box-containing protein [Desulfonatronum thiosulfatophilum]|uniref:Sensory/regulatory protein RpfC n=1 Tax=Desulfonatronum thiosulfatophilum TaxID=617002 RepID=A0A1G6AKY3_9BACT|nr:PAS domain S-box protein [Desulfonatronum thiosulfatophilum]SDB09046.1 PAS domain S-box-containing protein [Desulfonatronum thiosulfatophilum]
MFKPKIPNVDFDFVPAFDLQNIFDNAPIGIFTSTPEGRLLSINPAMADMFGYDSPEEMIVSVTNISEQLYADPDDRKELIRRLEENGEVTNYECRMLRRDGSVVWFSRNVRVIKGEGGRIVAFQGFTTDISERKLAEQREQKNEDRFRLMFMNAPMPYQSLDEQGNFLEVNQTFLDVLGYSRDELIGRNFGDFLHPDWKDHFKENFPRFKAVGEVLGVEFEMIKKDGSTILVYFTGKIQRDDLGRFERTHCIFQDITGRRQIEQALRESEQSFRTLIEGSPDIILRFDRMGRHLFASPNIESVTGMPSAEFIGKTHKELGFDEQMCAYWEEKLRQVFDHGEEIETDFEYNFGDRKIIFNWRLIPERKGKAIHTVLSISRDITRTKLAEEALQESEEKYHSLFNSMTELVVIHQMVFDEHGEAMNYKIINCNPAFTAITGIQREDALGGLATDVYRTETAPYLSEYTRVVLEGDPCRFNTYYEPMEKHFEIKAVNLENNFFATIASDVTNQKMAEQEIREKSSLLEGVLDNIPDIMSVKRPDLSVVRYNKAGYSLLNMNQKQVRGKKCFELIGRKMPCQPCTTLEAIHTKKIAALETYSPEMNMHLSCRANPILNEDGEVEYTVELLQDITNQKRAEEALLVAKKQAEAASKSKSEFLANMSHEIRTPINGIMGMMQLLDTTVLDEDQQQYVHLAKISAERLNSLLSDILDLSRVEAGMLELHESEFSMTELQESIIGLFSVTAKEKGLALECLMDPALPQRVIGDAARLRQILFNLVGNSLKYSDSGTVTVEMEPIKSWQEGACRVLFSVTDTGIGIPEDRVGDLFKPFVQVEGSYTRKYQGAGLGLAIVKRLVDLMDGRLCIESLEGQGTKFHIAFYFKLPFAKDPSRSIEASSPSSRLCLSILLVEDEPSNSFPTRKLLEKLGHKVTLAENGKQALDFIATHDFDFILMDIQMPVMNGIEATMFIRSSTDLGPKKDIPIIALTAYAMTGDRENFRKAGMNNYLAKPVMKDDLERMLEWVAVQSLGLKPVGPKSPV